MRKHDLGISKNVFGFLSFIFLHHVFKMFSQFKRPSDNYQFYSQNRNRRWGSRIISMMMIMMNHHKIYKQLLVIIFFFFNCIFTENVLVGFCFETTKIEQELFFYVVNTKVSRDFQILIINKKYWINIIPDLKTCNLKININLKYSYI